MRCSQACLREKVEVSDLYVRVSGLVAVIFMPTPGRAPPSSPGTLLAPPGGSTKIGTVMRNIVLKPTTPGLGAGAATPTIGHGELSALHIGAAQPKPHKLRLPEVPVGVRRIEHHIIVLPDRGRGFSFRRPCHHVGLQGQRLVSVLAAAAARCFADSGIRVGLTVKELAWTQVLVNRAGDGAEHYRDWLGGHAPSVEVCSEDSQAAEEAARDTGK